VDDCIGIVHGLTQIVPATQRPHLVRKLRQTAGEDASDMAACTYDRDWAAEKGAYLASSDRRQTLVFQATMLLKLGVCRVCRVMGTVEGLSGV